MCVVLTKWAKIGPNRKIHMALAIIILAAYLHTAMAEKEKTMLHYAIVFFIVALVAAILGFGGVAVAAAGVAKILFFIFLVLFIVSLIGHMARRV